MLICLRLALFCVINKYNIPFESSILHFQGRHLIIDWRKVRRYGYYQAEGHRGTEGDSWEGLPHNSSPGQIVHSPTVLAFEEIKFLTLKQGHGGILPCAYTTSRSSRHLSITSIVKFFSKHKHSLSPRVSYSDYCFLLKNKWMPLRPVQQYWSDILSCLNDLGLGKKNNS